MKGWKKENKIFQNLYLTDIDLSFKKNKIKRERFFSGSKYRSIIPSSSIRSSSNETISMSSIRRGMWAEWRSCSKRNFPRILVNDRSRLTYHCSRAIITPGRNQKPSFSFDQREDRCSWNRFNPLKRGIHVQSDLCWISVRWKVGDGMGFTKRNYENQLRFLANDKW